MFRFIFLLALLYGIFWCYNNINVENVKNLILEKAKNEKTVKTVTMRRAEMLEDNENALNGY